MKILFDLFPVILFFITYRLTGDIFIATPATMIASLVQIIFTWLRYHHVDTLLWVSFVLVIGLGSATMIFHDQLFIYWKPTVLYWIIGVALLLAKVIRRVNLIKKLMHTQLTLTDAGWNRLNLAWAFFFIIMGGLNLFIAFTFSESVWVNFKLFGTTGLTFLFVIIQTLLLSKQIHIKQDNDV